MPTGCNSGKKAVISWQVTAEKPQSSHPPRFIQSILATCVGTPAPTCTHTSQGPSGFLGFISTLISFLHYYLSSNLPQPPPAAPGHQHLSGVSGSSKVPVPTDTWSDVPSSSNIPSAQGLRCPPPALHGNPHPFPPSFKFLK